MMTWWRTCLCQSTLIQKGTSTWLLTCLHSLSGQIWGQDSAVPMVRGAVNLYLAVPDSAHQMNTINFLGFIMTFISLFHISFFAPTKKTWKWCWVCHGCLHVPSWSRGFPEKLNTLTIFFEKKALPPALAVILNFSHQDIKSTHLKVLNPVLFTSSLLFWHRSRMTTYVILRIMCIKFYTCIILSALMVSLFSL